MRACGSGASSREPSARERDARGLRRHRAPRCRPRTTCVHDGREGSGVTSPNPGGPRRVRGGLTGSAAGQEARQWRCRKRASSARRAALGDRDQHDPDVRDRAVRDDPADDRRVRRPAGDLRWVVGALLALADGLVWAELGGAMPGAGGTYVYLREAFQHRTGRLLPFLFVWTAMFTIPLIMSTGVIGLIQYLGYLIPDMSWVGIHGLSLIVVAIVLSSLPAGRGGRRDHRPCCGRGAAERGDRDRRLVTHFHADLAFDFTPGAFESGGAFWAGLGGGLPIGDLRLPRLQHDRLPRGGGQGPGPRAPALDRRSRCSGSWRLPPDEGRRARRRAVAGGVEVRLGRLARAGADVGQDRGRHHDRAHPRSPRSPRCSPDCSAARASRTTRRRTASSSAVRPPAPAAPLPARRAAGDGAGHGDRHLFTLTTVISVLLAVFVLIQGIAQIVALTVLRRGQPDLDRPYKMWLYPLPSLIALVGLGLHLHLLGPHPDHLLDRRDRRRHARVPRLGASRGGVAVRPGAARRSLGGIARWPRRRRALTR